MHLSAAKKWRRVRNRRRGDRVRATREKLAEKASRAGLAVRPLDWVDYAAALKAKRVDEAGGPA